MATRLAAVALSLSTMLMSTATSRLAGGEEDEADQRANRSIAVLSFRNLETFETRMAYILERSTGARTARRFTEWVAQFSGIVDRGVARDRPLGLVLHRDGDVARPLFFFPVEDRHTAHSAFEEVFPDREALGTTGVYRIDGSGPMFLRMRSRWCYVGFRKDSIVGRLPRPEEFMPPEAARYDVFLTLDIEGLASMRPRRETSNIVDPVSVEAWVRRLVAGFLGGGKRLDLGLNLQAGLRGELTLSTRPKSRLARSVRALMGQRSRFFLPASPGSVLDLRLTLPVPFFARDRRLAAYENAEVESSLPGLDMSWAMQFPRTILRKAWTTLKARLDGRVLDLALTVRMRPDGTLELALGAFLPGAASLDTWLRRNLALLKQLRLVREFELAKENLGGVSLHEIRPSGLKRSPFGRDPSIFVGTGEDVVYVAVGEDATALLQEIIHGPANGLAKERGGKSGPIYLQVSLGPVLKALGSTIDLPLADELGALQVSDRGRVRLLLESDAERVRLSYEFDESVFAPLVELLGRILDPGVLLDLGRTE